MDHILTQVEKAKNRGYAAVTAASTGWRAEVGTKLWKTRKWTGEVGAFAENRWNRSLRNTTWGAKMTVRF